MRFGFVLLLCALCVAASSATWRYGSKYGYGGIGGGWGGGYGGYGGHGGLGGGHGGWGGGHGGWGGGHRGYGGHYGYGYGYGRLGFGRHYRDVSHHEPGHVHSDESHSSEEVSSPVPTILVDPTAPPVTN